MLDKDRVIAEVNSKVGIRLGRNDPIFAEVTAMQLGLEEAAQKIETRFKALMDEFETHVGQVERLAGKTVAEEVKKCAGEIGRGLQSEIDAAGLKARELVQSVHAAHERPNMIFWASIGLLCALGLFFGGVWYGRLTAVP